MEEIIKRIDWIIKGIISDRIKVGCIRIDNNVKSECFNNE
jgi:hypothetical protein